MQDLYLIYVRRLMHINVFYYVCLIFAVAPHTQKHESSKGHAKLQERIPRKLHLSSSLKQKNKKIVLIAERC